MQAKKQQLEMTLKVEKGRMEDLKGLVEQFRVDRNEFTESTTSGIEQEKLLLDEYKITAKNIQSDLRQKLENLEENCQGIIHKDDDVRLMVAAETVSERQKEMHALGKHQIRKRSKSVHGREVA